MSFIFAFLSGLIFGIGLLISNMVNPEKVLNFLDLFGHWDPSLIFVMIPAIGISAIAFAFTKKRSSSLLGIPIKFSASKHIDRRLVIGNILFGIGWGLSGICPGPALVLLGAGFQPIFPFVLCMIIGMKIFNSSIKKTHD